MTQIFCVLPNAFYLTRFLRRVLPDASEWNIGGVGPSGVGAGVGHVQISFAFGGQRKATIQWNMGFRMQHEVKFTYLYKQVHGLIQYNVS